MCDHIFPSAAAPAEPCDHFPQQKHSASQAIRADALDKWLDNFVTNFKDVIHPVDVKVAMRAGSCALGAELFSPIVSVTRCLLRRRRSMVMAC